MENILQEFTLAPHIYYTKNIVVIQIWLYVLTFVMCMVLTHCNVLVVGSYHFVCGFRIFLGDFPMCVSKMG